jgi:hypothetical protein
MLSGSNSYRLRGLQWQLSKGNSRVCLLAHSIFDYLNDFTSVYQLLLDSELL